MVGVVGRGAITTPVRTLLAGAAAEDVVKAMDKVLPRPIDHFLLQADLTVVVPGPLERDLAEQLAAVARVESAGAAMVYRISEASIRRALDTGRTAGGAALLLLATLQNTCATRTHLPDRRCGPAARAVAGRHGRLVRALRGRGTVGAGDHRTRGASNWR